MDDLAEWLPVQLDEDERIARESGGAAWEELPVSGWVHTSPLPATEWQPPGYDHHVASAPLPADRAHIVRHDPARVLREIDATRRIIEIHRVVGGFEDEDMTDLGPGCDECGYSAEYGDRGGWCETVRLLALPYADRPGYREEWRL